MDQEELDSKLIYSSYLGNMKDVIYWIERGANIQVAGDDALCWAVARGHFEIAKYLISKGCKYSKLPPYLLKKILSFIRSHKLNKMKNHNEY